jgi:transposase
MAEDGSKVLERTKGQVREQLTDESDPKAIKRLIAAREYREGLSPAEIHARYGWYEQTIYGWLNRFEEREFEDALYDDDRPGHPPKLSDDQFQQVAETLHNSPEKRDTTSQHGQLRSLNSIS